MACVSGKVGQDPSSALHIDLDDDEDNHRPSTILEYKTDNSSLDIYDDYSLLYVLNGKGIEGALTKEEVKALSKLEDTYGFIVADGGRESLLLHGSGPSGYNEPGLSSEMKSLIFILLFRLNEEINEFTDLQS